MSDSIEILEADLDNESHQQAVLAMINEYACDAFGQSQPLDNDVRQALVGELRAHPTTHIMLAYSDEEPVGIAVCFRGFSTFKAKPLLNIHDLGVHRDHRGKGIGWKLLDAAERKARDLGCCRLTLEVADLNAARRLYRRFGFVGDDQATAEQKSWFMDKHFD